MKLTRSPLLWIIFGTLSLLSSYGAYYYFPQAFPIVNLNLTMDRSQALSKGKQIAHEFHLGPDEAQEAAMFHVDELVKTFIELEAGGKEALVAMMNKELYQPYTWRIRRFKEYDPNQSTIIFTPDGIPYGFVETISEDIPGATLSSSHAQALAQQFAQNDPWRIKLDEYKQVESSHEKKPSGRVDHIFLYERPDIKIGDGFYQLRIRVSGDHVSELTHMVQVPESFIRTYANMRSANENIAYAAKFALMLLYVIGGCIVGIFLLLRERWVLWKTPLWLALIISCMTTLQNINELPIRWISYNTAYSTTGFIIQSILGMIIEFIYWVFILFISFAAAESLTRKAFKNHIQLWSIWNPTIASSLPVLGHTLTGYFLVPILLFSMVIFYIYTTTFFGWWTPSNALFNPNILATYLPWWESIVISLRAGFWEECLFRAVPLASAALLGTHYGKRNWWIAGAFIVQAIIFGAAHANYPSQPAYARLVELLGVSSLFGGIYLRFGLLPAIITHYAYDVIWFSLPIFVSHASNAYISKIIIILMTLVPLWIVLYARIKMGCWFTLPKTAYNFSWIPLKETVKKNSRIIPQSITINPVYIYAVLGTGLCASILWVFTTRFESDGLAFTTTRTDAFKSTQRILEQKKVNPADWYPMVSVLTSYEETELRGARQRFVWQEGNKKIYHTLLGTYLTPAYWRARYTKFNGSLTDRAEEHQIYLKPDGSLYRYVHLLPEEQAGSTLDKTDAKAIAYAALFKQFELQPHDLVDISAIAQKKPNRLDWVFTFACNNDYPMEQGQARIEVTIGGNQLVDIRRYVHIPEQWQRTDENKQLITDLIAQFCGLFIYLLIIFGSIYAFMQLNVGIKLTTLLPFTLALTAIFLFELANSWPIVIAHFNTSQPFNDQLFRSFAIQAISLVMRAAMLGLLFSFIIHWQNIYRLIISPVYIYGIGASIGIITAAVMSTLEFYIPSLEPLWPNYTPLRFALPLNAGINSHLLNFISLSILLLLMIIVLNTITNGGKKNVFAGAATIIALSISISGIIYGNNIPLWMISSAAISMIYIFSYWGIARYTLAIVPPAVATYFSLYAIQQALFNAEPYGMLISGGSIIIMAFLAWFWSKALHNH